MPFFSFLQSNGNSKNDSISSSGGSSSSVKDDESNGPQPQSPNTFATPKTAAADKGPIEAIELEITVIQGQNLPPKDRAFFGLGKLTSSDPFVKV